MRTPVKIAAFAAVLVAAFAAAFGIGVLVGPLELRPTDEHAGSEAGTDQEAHQPDAHDAHGSGTHDSHDTVGHEASGGAHGPSGLLASDQGYTLDVEHSILPAGRPTVRFTIRDAVGRAVTDFVENHEKDLHLIAVRRDLSGFQHVHPAMAPDGTWSVPLTLSPGQWRLFADFVPRGGENLTLGTDLAVAGDYTPQPLPAPSTTARVDDYTVTLRGELKPGQPSRLTLTVSRDGEPVTDLQPYLGAYGHLVALRAGDLAYLHVHPGGVPGDGTTKPGPDITFDVTPPSAGEYRLFLDFRHAGEVRTAEFTVHVDPTPRHDGEHGEAGHGGSSEHGDGRGEKGHDGDGHDGDGHDGDG
jgi:hypothetical protein